MSSTPKTLGLTFGGGGTKGFAHVGLYKVLYEAKVPIHSIAGCSIGALVAAAVAQERSPEEIMDVMRHFAEAQSTFFRLSNISFEKGSLLKGEEEYEVVKQLIPENLEFKDLKIPLIVNAVDLEKGDQVAFSEGNVLQAVLASMSIPGIFPPIYANSRLLVDGGVLNSIPVDLCRSLGAKVQVAVNLRSFYTEQNISGLIYNFYVKKDVEKRTGLEIPKHYFKDAMLKAEFPLMVLLRSVCIAEEAYQQRIIEDFAPDLLIHPDVTSYSFLDTSKYAELYQKGLEAGEAHLKQIQELLK